MGTGVYAQTHDANLTFRNVTFRANGVIGSNTQVLYVWTDNTGLTRLVMEDCTIEGATSVFCAG